MRVSGAWAVVRTGAQPWVWNGPLKTRLSDVAPQPIGFGLSGMQPAQLLVCSRIRSKFKAPKMAPSHGLTGLAAIKPGANQPTAAAGRSSGRGRVRLIRLKQPSKAAQSPVHPGKAAFSAGWLFNTKPRPTRFCGAGGGKGAACRQAGGAASKAAFPALRMVWTASLGMAGPVPLQKQERIQGPENGSIARFDGILCYRSGSEKHWLAAGGRRLRNGLLGCRDTRRAGRNAAPLPCKRPVKPGLRVRSYRMPLKAGRRMQNTRQTQPGCARFRSLFGSQFKAPKTPLSHGLAGLGAIKPGARWAAGMGFLREGKSGVGRRKKGGVAWQRRLGALAAGPL